MAQDKPKPDPRSRFVWEEGDVEITSPKSSDGKPESTPRPTHKPAPKQ